MSSKAKTFQTRSVLHKLVTGEVGCQQSECHCTWSSDKSQARRSHDLQQIFSIAKYFITLRWLFFFLFTPGFSYPGRLLVLQPRGAVPRLLCAVLRCLSLAMAAPGTAGSCRAVGSPAAPCWTLCCSRNRESWRCFSSVGSELIHFKSSQWRMERWCLCLLNIPDP